MKYPPTAEPYVVEIEATNHCNASCVMCPHSSMKRPVGFMNTSKFISFLDELNEERKSFWMNTQSRNINLPKIVFAGLGDPLLHPDIIKMIEASSSRNFKTQLITNGALLNLTVAENLKKACLSCLAISLHSINPDVYKSITRLDLRKIIPGITAALKFLDATDVETELWRIKAPRNTFFCEKSEDQILFDEYVKQFIKVKVLGPTDPWSRDSIVLDSVWPIIHDSDNVWCQKLYFTSNVAWDGTSVMCCVDFNRISKPLGNIFEDGYKATQEIRQRIFTDMKHPEICNNCRRWKDNTYEEEIFPQIVSI